MRLCVQAARAPSSALNVGHMPPAHPSPPWIPAPVGQPCPRSLVPVLWGSEARACAAPGKSGRSGQGLPGPCCPHPQPLLAPPQQIGPTEARAPAHLPAAPTPQPVLDGPEGEAGRGGPAAPPPSPDVARRVWRLRPELGRTLPEPPAAGPQDPDPAHLPPWGQSQTPPGHSLPTSPAQVPL